MKKCGKEQDIHHREKKGERRRIGNKSFRKWNEATTKEDGSDLKVWLNGQRHLVKNAGEKKNNATKPRIQNTKHIRNVMPNK